MSILSKKTKEAIHKVCYDAMTPNVRRLLHLAIERGETPLQIEQRVKTVLTTNALLPAKVNEIANQYYLAATYIQKNGHQSAESASDNPTEQPGHAL